MGTDYFKEFEDEIKGISTEELKRNLATDIYGETGQGGKQSKKRRLVDNELKRRENETQKIRFNKMLEATEKTATSTGKLVKATWGLFWATLSLVLFNLISYLSKGN